MANKQATREVSLVYALTVNNDTQEKLRIDPVDSIGRVTKVDARGFVMESVEGGEASVVIDPREPGDNLNLIAKPDRATDGTTTVSGYIDADVTEGEKRIGVQFVITTIPAEAVGGTITSRGKEALDAEVEGESE